MSYIFKRLGGTGRHQFRKKINIKKVNEKATYGYLPKSYSGRVVSFQPKTHFIGQNDPKFGWGDLIQEGLAVKRLPIYPKGMLVEPFVKKVAKELQNVLSYSLINSQKDFDF